MITTLLVHSLPMNYLFVERILWRNMRKSEQKYEEMLQFSKYLMKICNNTSCCLLVVPFLALPVSSFTLSNFRAPDSANQQVLWEYNVRVQAFFANKYTN